MTSPKHIVFHTASAWSHVKPLLALAVRIAQQRPASAVVATFLVPLRLYQQIQRELAMVSGMPERINVIAFVGPDGDVRVKPEKSIAAQQFAPTFAALWESQSVWCHATQRAFQGLPRPSLAILDAFTTYAVDAVRTIGGADCPQLSWMPTPAAPMLRLFGPEELGGFGDLKGKIDADAALSGKPAEEIGMNVYRKITGEIVRVPGLPDAYDYESFPQEDLLDVTPYIQNVHRCLLAADGVILVTCSAVDGEALPAGRRWLGSRGKQIWAIGPLEDMPSGNREVSQPSQEEAQILQFLDGMQAMRGERSVIFIAFGTAFYPKDPAKLFAFVTELLDSGVPFLWSHASPFAKLPEDLAARIDDSALAHHANWVPQRAVLGHPATMWFVSHGRWNSVQEALGLRVPLAFWPFGGDQPYNAATLTLTHNAAFELLSVREGAGARQPLRADRAGIKIDFTIDGVREETRQLLLRMRNEEGARIRANARKLGEAMDSSWHPGGDASTQLEALLRKYVDQA